MEIVRIELNLNPNTPLIGINGTMDINECPVYI